MLSQDKNKDINIVRCLNKPVNGHAIKRHQYVSSAHWGPLRSPPRHPFFEVGSNFRNRQSDKFIFELLSHALFVILYSLITLMRLFMWITECNTIDAFEEGLSESVRSPFKNTIGFLLFAPPSCVVIWRAMLPTWSYYTSYKLVNFKFATALTHFEWDWTRRLPFIT